MFLLPIEQPKWKSQPRLTQPPPSSILRPFRPPEHLTVRPPHLQQPPPQHAVKKPLTYGEYRRLKEEAERRNNPLLHQPQPQVQPQVTPPQPIPVVMNRRDPRRPPKQVSHF